MLPERASCGKNAVDDEFFSRSTICRLIYSPMSLASAIDIAQFDIPALANFPKMISNRVSQFNKSLSLSLMFP
jgi:hypothetical protein